MCSSLNCSTPGPLARTCSNVRDSITFLMAHPFLPSYVMFASLPGTSQDEHPLTHEAFLRWQRENEAVVAEDRDAIESRLGKLEKAAEKRKKIRKCKFTRKQIMSYHYLLMWNWTFRTSGVVLACFMKTTPKHRRCRRWQ